MVCCLNDRTALSGQNDLGRLLNGLLSGLLNRLWNRPGSAYWPSVLHGCLLCADETAVVLYALR